MHRRTRTSAFLLLFAMLATACAGEAGKLDSAAPPSNPIGETAAAASPAGPSHGGAPGTVPATVGPTSATNPAGSAARPSSGSATERGATPAGRPGGTASTSGGSPRGPSAGQPGAPSPNGSPASGPMASGPTASSSPSAASGSPVPSLPAPSGTRTGVTTRTVNVGVFFPKTGPLAGLFRNIPAVAQAAFDEAGPIHGRKLVLKTYDDGTANASTIQVEEKRAKDEAFALVSVIGESNSVLAPLADQHRVPIIIGNADEKVIAPLTHAFPVLPYWARQARILPGFIQNVLGGGTKRIGIVYMGARPSTPRTPSRSRPKKSGSASCSNNPST
jgi:Periplasmic binding protein